ncbi:MAG TPA: cohesin domain-containing protein, partial [Xanthomonadales bacterium]|nr:cohesin domain-containing protein [Xanthomonadales bacterium]
MNSTMLKVIALALALISTGAFAQTITVGNGNGLPGELVVVPVNFATGANQIGNFTVDIAYDATKFSAAVGDCSVMNISQLSQSCSGGGGAGIIRITGSRGTGELTTGLVANLNMTIANDAPV